MGTKNDKMTGASMEQTRILLDKLAPLGAIQDRKMFGGHGVFLEERMFAIVDSGGSIFFKADDTNVAIFVNAGSEKHGRMSYYKVPETILSDEKTLLAWARSSIEVARKAKK